MTQDKPRRSIRNEALTLLALWQLEVGHAASKELRMLTSQFFYDSEGRDRYQRYYQRNREAIIAKNLARLKKKNAA